MNFDENLLDLPPEIQDEILEWTGRISPERRLDLLTLCRRVYPRIQALIVERVIFKIIQIIKPGSVGPDYDRMKRIFEGFLSLIDAHPHLSLNIKDLYKTSVGTGRFSSSLFNRCPNLRHVACHVAMTWYSPPTDGGIIQRARWTSPPDRTADLSGLLSLNNLRSLSVTLETLCALLRVSDSSSPWIQNLTHVEAMMEAPVGLHEPYAEAFPSLTLLHSLTHFAIIGDAYMSKRQLKSIADGIPVILKSAPSLALLAVLEEDEEYEQWTKKDPRVVVLEGTYYEGSSAVASGWEKEIDGLAGGLWVDAEKVVCEQQSKLVGHTTKV